MYKNGPIIVIEDDRDDQEILEEIFTNLGYPNEVKFFPDGETALEYLIDSDNKPFIIISDINLPRLNGLELRDKIHNNEELRLKCIPYLFLTTAVSHRAVIDAYSKSVQGFFVKPPVYADLEQMIDNIIKYWRDCTAPNYLE